MTDKSGRQREKEREGDRQTERQTETYRKRRRKNQKVTGTEREVLDRHTSRETYRGNRQTNCRQTDGQTKEQAELTS